MVVDLGQDLARPPKTMIWGGRFGIPDLEIMVSDHHDHGRILRSRL